MFHSRGIPENFIVRQQHFDYLLLDILVMRVLIFEAQPQERLLGIY